MLKCLRSVEFCDEPEEYDAADPDHTEDDGDAVQVALGNPRGTEIRCNSPSEHVGEPATSPAVQQDQQGKQKAREAEDDLERNLKNIHE